MDYQPQNTRSRRTATAATKLTAKGRRTRARIIDVAARLIWERGVTATTLEDVKLAAEVSSSQLYHYFVDKERLVNAVIEHQADKLVNTTEDADLGTTERLAAWRDLVIEHASAIHGQGGCPLGSLGSQLAEADPAARTLVSAGFGRWTRAIQDAMRSLHGQGRLREGLDPDDLAVTVLAALQGGLLLAQVHRDPRPLQTTLDTIFQMAGLTGPNGVPAS
ncbi:TetR/AcrR family transcriptional regulator [Mycolicibacterium sediminis]|uniref:Transcriptional regulator n=1 Tax=Mycolicibacterium sediminis TaxID=1286180 RepID=A0A7I7R0Z9_9MYCO|nr:TetR/AcrR family transcriptional regulator [Mycolicibacterium sediminis]BBY31790.1 transcriptional regulator [Mycolicibacterium sediminis]